MRRASGRASSDGQRRRRSSCFRRARPLARAWQKRYMKRCRSRCRRFLRSMACPGRAATCSGGPRGHSARGFADEVATIPHAHRALALGADLGLASHTARLRWRMFADRRRRSRRRRDAGESRVLRQEAPGAARGTRRLAHEVATMPLPHSAMAHRTCHGRALHAAHLIWGTGAHRSLRNNGACLHPRRWRAACDNDGIRRQGFLDLVQCVHDLTHVVTAIAHAHCALSQCARRRRTDPVAELLCGARAHRNAGDCDALGCH
mmetsp:Transcript_172/g.412  ORF Transcript_172/g.412 Transcript_172/m.412 type:complete len:262 (-) Transcript_172:304-1089(-)